VNSPDKQGQIDDDLAEGMTVTDIHDLAEEAAEVLPEVEITELVTIVPVPNRADARGSLFPFELERALPFSVKRAFLISDVPPGTVRGRHGHLACWQCFWCFGGPIKITVSDGQSVARTTLSDPSVALVVPPPLWAKQQFLEEGSTLITFASHPFDPDDYFDTLTPPSE
jgi:dTDP-4-dehydrorhamnose 3,5-epimerase-like enzyme